MSTGTSLDQILADLNAAAPKSTKVASAPAAVETGKVAEAKAELLSALKRVEATKTASEKKASTPVSDLEKIATEIASADHDALVKEASFYGAAIADGFMARLGQFEKAAEALPEAPVATPVAATVDVEKIATEAVRGYIETQNAMKVAAEQEFTRGYNDTIAEVEKLANEVFAHGEDDAKAVLATLA